MNAFSYKEWVFDDPVHGLLKEGLINGIDKMLDKLTYKFVGPVQLTISDEPIDGAVVLDYIKSDTLGPLETEIWHKYWCDLLNQEGWLCPSFLLYFQVPPEKIYVRIEEL